MTPSVDQVLNAASFAARPPTGQYRKDGVTPYVSHVFRVCMIVRHVFGFDDPRMLLAALLHDTIEDTTTDFDDLDRRFGAEVATWVSLLTKDKRLPEAEREQVYMQRLLEAPWQVQVCKLADMYDNLSDVMLLPTDRRAHSLRRCEQYFSELRRATAPQAREPIALLSRLIEETRQSLALHGTATGK